MKLGEHRGMLSDSMETVIEIPATMDALKSAIDNSLQFIGIVNVKRIHVKHYCFDKRINWDTHIVTIDDYGVFGFTDAPVPNARHNRPSEANVRVDGVVGPLEGDSK